MGPYYTGARALVQSQISTVMHFFDPFVAARGDVLFANRGLLTLLQQIVFHLSLRYSLEHVFDL
jgi:hypothetical protein